MNMLVALRDDVARNRWMRVWCHVGGDWNHMHDWLWDNYVCKVGTRGRHNSFHLKFETPEAHASFVLAWWS